MLGVALQPGASLNDGESEARKRNEPGRGDGESESWSTPGYIGLAYPFKKVSHLFYILL